jgi:hypothetical protein
VKTAIRASGACERPGMEGSIPCITGVFTHPARHNHNQAVRAKVVEVDTKLPAARAWRRIDAKKKNEKKNLNEERTEKTENSLVSVASVAFCSKSKKETQCSFN